MPTIPAPGTSAPDTGDAASLVPPNPYPTTQFAPGAKTASVSDGDLTATITMTRRPDIDPDVDVPILTITVAGKPVLEADDALYAKGMAGLLAGPAQAGLSMPYYRNVVVNRVDGDQPPPSKPLPGQAPLYARAR